MKARHPLFATVIAFCLGLGQPSLAKDTQIPGSIYHLDAKIQVSMIIFCLSTTDQDGP